MKKEKLDASSNTGTREGGQSDNIKFKEQALGVLAFSFLKNRKKEEVKMGSGERRDKRREKGGCHTPCRTDAQF